MSTIAIIAPSSRGEINPENVAALEAHGHSVVIHPQCYLQDNQSAGTAAQRAEAVMDVFRDKHIDIIMAAQGGNRSMHILPLLDFDVIAKNAKPFISFSDGTALINTIYAKTGITSFHGPTLSRITRAQNSELDQMFACLSGHPNTVDLSAATVLHGGRARAPMMGGNLSVFASLCGTPYMPDCRGKIIFLEDIGDQLSRYDRMLAQLRLAGVFDQAAAVIFGVMHAEGDSSVTPFGFELDDILQEHTAYLKIPVLIHAPFGHKGLLPTFPLGGMVTLDAGAKLLSIG